MIDSSDTSLAALLLTNRLTRAEAKPYAAGEFWKLVDRVRNVADLDIGDLQTISARGVLELAEAARISVLLDEADSLQFERERLQGLGVSLISAFDVHFPLLLRERLGTRCPPFLFVAGPIQGLQGGGLSIAGSRNADEAILDLTRTAALAAVERKWSTITGLAKGVDQEALVAASEGNGGCIGIPTEGIEIILRHPGVRQLVHDGGLCIASPYGPRSPFRAGTAMGRNKMIYALSSVAFVASADHGSGGTWSGAIEALKHRWCPVTTWSGPGARDGNRALVKLGARPIDRVEQLFEPIELTEPEATQASLF